MPSIKSISLELTPEEWELLCKMWDWHATKGEKEYTPYHLEKDFSSILKKISEINKRLCFAASLPDN